MDPIAAARYGMMVAASRFEAAAQSVARPGGADDVQTVSDLGQARRQYVAQTRTLGVADEMWRALMDLQAAGRAGA